MTMNRYLKRELHPFDRKYRLDSMLLERAKAGVKVYVLIWDESNLGINLASRWVKVFLENLHKYVLVHETTSNKSNLFIYIRNIRVIRHPRFNLSWSHHQKTVMIDQNVAFLGGIDLCPGRFDTDNFL